MPTTLRNAEDALERALREIEAIGEASGWRDSCVVAARYEITVAIHAIASTDLEECREWMEKETCLRRTGRSSLCGSRATVVQDGEGRCERHADGALLVAGELC